MSVTVVIPCYNAARYLAETLDSVAAQTLQPAEVVVVDDGSTDDSPAIARRWGARVIGTGGNQGPSTARNMGGRAARTPLVAFVDADDLWSPTHLETMVGYLTRYPEANVASGRIQKFGAASNVSPVTFAGGVPVDALWTLVENNVVPQSTVVARWAAIEAVGAYPTDMRYSEDYDLWLRLAAAGPFVYNAEISCRYRVHAAQATQTRNAEAVAARASWRARTRLLTRLTAADDPRAPQLRARLGAIYGSELRLAWRCGNRPWFDALFDLRDTVPDGEATAAGWRLGRSTFGVWQPTHRALSQARRALKGVLRRPVAPQAHAAERA